MYSGESPIRIVLDPKAELPINLNLCADKGASIFITEAVEKKLSPDKEFISVPESESHISDILKLLYKRGISQLLVEGGAKTIQKFINSNNWDEARIITSIKPLSGGIRAPYLTGRVAESYRLQSDTISIVYNDRMLN
jgi:diaminohydroxyphosphoribosylaminopyrimidine deaminase/5-amino-6-(5-phosphoribosylamino)uracil reductase